MNQEIQEVDKVDNKLHIISIDKGDDEFPSSRSSNNKNNNKMFKNKNNNNENPAVSMKDFLQVKDEIRLLNQKMDLLLQTIQNLDKSNNGNNSFNNNSNNNNYNKNNSRSHT